MVGPGREHHEHRPTALLSPRQWLVFGAVVLLAVGLTLGLVFGLSGSPKKTPTVGTSLTTTTTVPASATTTVPSSATTVPASTTTTP